MPDQPPDPPVRSLDDIIAAIQSADKAKAEGLPPPGRPSKYTPALGAHIILALSNGATRRDAAALNGIDYKTFWRWLKDGTEDENSEFRKFALQVETAEAELMTRLAQVVIKAAVGDPKYALEVLKRRRRTEWGDSLNVKDLTTEQLLELYGLMPSDDSGGADPA